MKPAVRTILTTAALLIAAAVQLGASDGRRTLNGNFMSGYQDRVKPLRAVFTPAGGGGWQVAFFFEFNGRDHEFRGTAEGSLGEGELSGRVQNEDRQRTFTFKGSFESGLFKGTHAEIGRRGEQQTGTLTLRD